MSLIGDRSTNLVKVVSAHRSKGAAAANVLMQLVLQVNERIVARNIKANITKDTSDNTRTHSLGLRLYNDLLEVLALVLNSEPRKTVEAEVDAESFGDAFYAEQVISVRGDLNLVDVLI